MAIRVFEVLLVRILPLIYKLDLLIIKPSYSFSVLPEAESHLASLWVFIHPEAMLLTFEKPAFIFSVVLPAIEAISCLFVEFKLSFVDLAISIVINAHTMHKIVVPPPIVFPTIIEMVLA